MNEVKGKDPYAKTDLFKTRITDSDREIELKGKDTITITNYASYILNTNNICTKRQFAKTLFAKRPNGCIIAGCSALAEARITGTPQAQSPSSILGGDI